MKCKQPHSIGLSTTSRLKFDEIRPIERDQTTKEVRAASAARAAGKEKPHQIRSPRIIIMDAYYAVGFQFKYVFNQMCWYGKLPWACCGSFCFSNQNFSAAGRCADTTIFGVSCRCRFYPFFSLALSRFVALRFTHHWNGTRVIGLKSMTSTHQWPYT